MKIKVFLLSMICLLLLTLFGCGQVKKDTMSDRQSVSEETEKDSTSDKQAVSDEAEKDTEKEIERNASMESTNQMILTMNGQELTATLSDNSSAEALKELLADGPLTITMNDYANMEKVGDIGTALPTNDKQITTEAGDLILYLGRSFVIYYAPNSWNFTRLGKINDITAQELKSILGDGDVDITLSLQK